MLGITKQLLDFLKGKQLNSAIVQRYVQVILKKGSVVDTNTLFDFFLENPSDSYRANILDLLFKFGTPKHIECLLATCLEGERLKEGCPEEILHLLFYTV